MIMGKLADYIGDKKTESILFRVIRNNIMDAYKSFISTIESEYPFSFRSLVLEVKEMTQLMESNSSIIVSPTPPSSHLSLS